MQNRAFLILWAVVLVLALSCSQTSNNASRLANTDTASEANNNTNITSFSLGSLPMIPQPGERSVSETDFTKVDGPWIEHTSTQTVFTNSPTVEIDTLTNTQSLVLQSTSVGKKFTSIYAIYGLGGVFDPAVSKPTSVTVNLNSITIPTAGTGFNIGIADYNSLNDPAKHYAPWQWITNIEDNAYTVKFSNLFSDDEKKVPINPVSPKGSIYIVVLVSSKVTARVQRLIWNFNQLDGRFDDGSKPGPFVSTSIERSPTDLPNSRIYYPYPYSSDPYFDPFKGIYRPAGQCPVVVLIPQRDVNFVDFDPYYKDLIARLVSWGFIVVFPNYEDTSVAPKKFSEIFKYIDTCFAYMLNENSKSSSPFFGKVLTSRRLVVGVGYGGGAALSYAATSPDPNLQAALAIAPIDSDISGDQKFADSFIGPKLNRPIFIVSGELDGIAKKADIKKLFDLAGTETNSQKFWFEIKGGNHNQFFSAIVPIAGDNFAPTVSKTDQLRIMNRYAVASLQTALGVNYQLPLMPEINPKFYGKLAEIWTKGTAGAADTFITRTIAPTVPD